MPTEQFALRPGEPGDLPELAAQYVRVREAARPGMPPLPVPEERVRQHFESWDLDRREVWVAHAGERLLGHAVLVDSWLEGLYVEAPAQGSGIGSALMDVVKLRRPDGFCLWVFVTNTAAREFYRAHGLIDLEETDGSANPEGCADVRMAWPGAEPLAFLRGLIDEVDEQFGDLLARRTALTRAVQPHKAEPGRDREREHQISHALARRVPALGPTRVERIMDVIISESLDALHDRA